MNEKRKQKLIRDVLNFELSGNRFEKKHRDNICCEACYKKGKQDTLKQVEDILDNLPIDITKNYATGGQRTMINLKELKQKLSQLFSQQRNPITRNCSSGECKPLSCGSGIPADTNIKSGAEK